MFFYNYEESKRVLCYEVNHKIEVFLWSIYSESPNFFRENDTHLKNFGHYLKKVSTNLVFLTTSALLARLARAVDAVSLYIFSGNGT